ncbi:MAG: hypothetical protein QM723_09285 [Myxococcaceae bacterium]
MSRWRKALVAAAVAGAGVHLLTHWQSAYYFGGDWVPSPLSKFCGQDRERACVGKRDFDSEVRSAARREWQTEARCTNVRSGSWWRGTWVEWGGGFGGATYWFDADGHLLEVHTTSEGEQHEYGFTLGLTEGSALTRGDYCEQVRATMVSKGVRVRVSGAVTIDGLPPKPYPRYGEPSYELGFGKHTVVADGETIALEVIDGPGHQVMLDVGKGPFPADRERDFDRRLLTWEWLD